VLIFNGDWDACVPYTDGQAWTKSMGFALKNPWHVWTYTSTEGNANQGLFSYLFIYYYLFILRFILLIITIFKL
jgi:cathepsin A (carboxypeptidase C)/serine carboxypeptidase-like clade 1